MPAWWFGARGAAGKKTLSCAVFYKEDTAAGLCGQRCHRLGLWRKGVVEAARWKQTNVLVTVGTGIGAGIVLNGSLYRGSHFGAGEIGYMVEERDLVLPAQPAEFGAFERRALPLL